ncbi:MAG: 60 kDa inner rane insertion protein, partial [Verrucomicrobiaceae bacterium]|nr:60 kDa inner rane insertion protein [Verrucomicrobiaceae bacterium]
MDRKAWIVVTICCTLMGLNLYYTSQLPKTKPVPAATAPATPAAGTAATAEAAKTTPAAPGAPVTPGAAAALPEETRELKIDSVRYVLSTKGGGVKEAHLAAQDQVVLNTLAKDAIGAFRREAKTADETPYKIVEATDKAVTFEGTTADNLSIRKTFSVTEGPGTDPHMLRMAITLTNKGTVAHKSDQHYIYAGAAASLSPGDIVPAAVFWNNGGDSDYKEATYFTAGLMSAAKTEFAGGPYEDFRFGGVSSRFYAHIISTTEQPGVRVQGRVWAEPFLVDHSHDEFKDHAGAKADHGIQGAIGMAPLDLAPEASKTINYEIYLGPKEYHRLSELGNHREDV